MKRVYVVIVVWVAVCGPLQAFLWAENPYLTIEQALKSDAERVEIDTVPLLIEAEWERFGDAGELVLSVQAAVQAEEPEEMWAEIDEAFGVLYTGYGDISAGRQRIAWGVLDALSVLDRVHAPDMRVYTDPWRENERMAVDGLRWKYYGRRWFAEAVWEPVVRRTEWPEQFAPSQLYPAGVPVVGLAREPSWDSSGVGGRICWYLNRADIGVQAGKSANRDPLPVLEGEVPADFLIRETQTEYYQVGVWTVVPLKNWILRFEGAANYRFPELSEDGREVVREDRLQAAGGLEWNGPGGMRVLLEGAGTLDTRAEDIGHSLEQQYMAGVSRSFLRERLGIEAGGVYSTGMDGYGGEVRIDYNLRDGIQLRGGLNYLVAAAELFGELAGTAVWFSLQWTM